MNTRTDIRFLKIAPVSGLEGDSSNAIRVKIKDEGCIVLDEGGLSVGSHWKAQLTDSTSFVTGLQLETDTEKVYLSAPAINNVTTASAANVYLDYGSTMRLMRSTSSLRYKQDISDFTGSDGIYDLRPVFFRDKAEVKADTTGARWYIGLLAEEVDKVFPEIVTYLEGEPDAVMYDRVPILMLNEIKRMKSEIERLSAEIEALKRA